MPDNITDTQPIKKPTIPKDATVLVVEDNRDVAESMATLLRLSGHEVRVAEDGSSAIETATRQKPDLVFIDIGLPGMDGYQLAQALRAIPELAGARLVALSGYGQEQAKRRARDVGMDEYFVKPIQPSDLVAVMTRVQPRPPK